MDVDFGGNTMRGLAAPAASDQPARLADTNALAQPRPIDISGAVTEKTPARIDIGAGITLSTRSYQRVRATASSGTLTLPATTLAADESVSIMVDILIDGTSGRAVTFAAPAGESLKLHANAQPAVNGAANKLSKVLCTRCGGETWWTVVLAFREG